MFRECGLAQECSGRFERFVERALAVAFEVERDVGEAGGLELLGDRGGHFGRERARHFVGSDFDAREFVVQAHAELPEAQVAQSGFAAFDQS